MNFWNTWLMTLWFAIMCNAGKSEEEKTEAAVVKETDDREVKEPMSLKEARAATRYWVKLVLACVVMGALCFASCVYMRKVFTIYDYDAQAFVTNYMVLIAIASIVFITIMTLTLFVDVLNREVNRLLVNSGESADDEAK